MSRIVFSICVFVCLSGMVFDVYGLQLNDLVQLKIIDKNSFSSDDRVTREECVTILMKAIGATDEEINLLDGADLITFADTDIYSYIGCAYMARIVFGEECTVDYPTIRTRYTRKNTDYFFFPNRSATVKESLAFMIRCLEPSDETDYDTTIEKASNYRLILDNDTFIKNPDSPINKQDFCVILTRFLQEKRYKYYARENNNFRMNGNIDKNGSITYLEFLTENIK